MTGPVLALVVFVLLLVLGARERRIAEHMELQACFARVSESLDSLSCSYDRLTAGTLDTTLAHRRMVLMWQEAERQEFEEIVTRFLDG